MPAALGAAAVLACCAGATAAGADTAPAGTPAVAPALTDYARGYGTWAYPDAPGAPIHAGPSGGAPVVSHLRAATEDGLPEVYELLGTATDARGTRWVQVMIPMRPNGRTGWVLGENLGPAHLVPYLLVINRGARRLTLLRHGRAVFHARVGVGKPSTPTPAGHFWIREKFPVHGVPLYGPYAIGTSNYSAVETDWPGGGVVGIHGTDQPRLIPGAPSHGCIRLRNGDITRLYRILPVGTPLLIV